MKIRNGFVSNSSSSSFVVTCLPWVLFRKGKSNKKILTEKQESVLIKYGFKKTTISNPSAIENNPDSLEKEFCEANEKEGYNYGFNIFCNQQDVIDFLTKNRIPFKAVTHYDDDVVIYNGGDTYFTIPNLGNRISMHGHEDPKKEFLETIMGHSLIEETFIKDIHDSWDRKVKARKEIKGEKK
jgi:hypothetical protein